MFPFPLLPTRKEENGKASQFIEKFFRLCLSERKDIYNSYCNVFDLDARIEDNHSYNMSVYFEDVIDALRAAEYGEYSVTDDYFKLNIYGNLVSFGDLDVMEYINEKIEDIYEHPEFWKEYIDPECDVEDNE